MFSPSTQCTEASKKGKTVDLHNKALLPRYLVIGFRPLIRGLSASASWIWYASLFAKPRGRYQPFRANSKISNNVGKWHYSSRLQGETAVAGPSFLAAVTTSGWPNYRLHGPFVYWFSSLLLIVALEGTLTRYFKVRVTAEGEGRHNWWGLWNTRIGSQYPSLQLFMPMFSRKSLGRSLSSSPHFSTPPLTHLHTTQ